MTALDRAKAFIAQGWTPLPVPHRQKKTLLSQWPKMTLADATAHADRWFADPSSNVGVSLGERSGGLVDIDLDCPEAVLLAPDFLPPTRTFGRPGNPDSHWLFLAADAQTAKFAEPAPRGVKPKMLVELRSTGCQTVFPGSTHESGELIDWTDVAVPITTVDAAQLRRRVAQLGAGAALVRSGIDRKQAFDIVNGDLTEFDHPLADQVRKWLGVKKPTAADRRNRERSERQERAAAESPLAVAIAKYNAAHPADWPRSGGECPGCGHRECFGRLDGSTDRWVCFAASHTAPGVAGQSCFTGDALDLDAHAAELAPVEFLRHEGYLPPEDPRPEFTYERGEGHKAIAFALSALAQDDDVYQHGPRLVQVGEVPAPEGGDAKGARVIPVGTGRVWNNLSKRIRWTAYSEEAGLRSIHPPNKVVAAVAEWSLWPGVRHLNGIVTVPVLRRDGELVDRPGYDPVSRLFYAPRGRVPVVAAKPTRDDAVRAARALLEVVADFPLASSGHRAAWISAVLTVVARPAFDGPAPLFLFDANTRGSGKTLLCELIGLITTGQSVPRTPFAEEDAEIRKRITAHVLDADAMVLIDNVPNGGTIGWPCLDAALTARVWRDRILGKSENVTLPNNIVWFASGNNIGVRADVARRVLKLRLESPEEHPEERSGFAHDPIERWVLAERDRLLAEALTLVRAFIVAGRPAQHLGAIGSFGEWSELVRQAVVWAGLSDPLETWASRDADVDPEAAVHIQLLTALVDFGADKEPVTAADVLLKIDNDSGGHSALRAAVLELCGTRDGRLPTARTLGERWRRLKGRRRTLPDGRLAALGQADKARNGVAKWRVEFEVQGEQSRQGQQTHDSVNAPREDRAQVEFSFDDGFDRDDGDPDGEAGTAGTRPRRPRSPCNGAAAWTDGHDFEDVS